MNDGITTKSINKYLFMLAGFSICLGEGNNLFFSSISLIYPFVLCIIIFYNFNLLRNNWKLMPKSFIALYGLIIIHVFFSVFLIDITDQDIYIYSRYIIFIISCLFFSYLFRDPMLLNSFFKALGIGFIVSILLSNPFKDYSISRRMVGGLGDPNIFALESLVIFALSFYYCIYVKPKSRLSILFNYSLLLISLLCIFFSLSRGAFLALGVCAIIITTFLIKRKSFFIYSFFIIAILFSIFFVGKDILEERASIVSSIETGGANRTSIWTMYLQHINDYIVWGTGLHKSNIAIKNNLLVDDRYETHNQYLCYFVEFGIFIGLLYICYMYNIVKMALSKKRPIYIPLLVFIILIVSMFLNIHHGRFYWIAIAIINSHWYSYHRAKYQAHSFNYRDLKTI